MCFYYSKNRELVVDLNILKIYKYDDETYKVYFDDDYVKLVSFKKISYPNKTLYQLGIVKCRSHSFIIINFMDGNNVRIKNQYKKGREEIYNINLNLNLNKWEKCVNEMSKFEFWCNKIYNT
jgi:hypothetical protein